MLELAETCARGYAISRSNVGVMSMGCALLAKASGAAAAISISASTEGLGVTWERRIADALLATCHQLSETVGYL